jgi:1-deoxy-D-xylulose-5-phosphate reductoisomerase
MVSVLGSTGSIGVNTLDVIARHPERFGVFALAANTSVREMIDQCARFMPRYAVMMDGAAADRLREQLPADGGTEVLQGEAGLEQVVTDTQVDVVMAAIVGSAGLPSTLAAARAGKTLLLANKESLVMGGHLLMEAVQQAGARLLPIDSEHNAIFQCMPVDDAARPRLRGVSKVLLTASGGPFRTWSLSQMRNATPDQACAQPDEQGAGVHRGLLDFWPGPGRGGGRGAPAEYYPLHGALRGRLGAGPDGQPGHAHTDRLRPGLARKDRCRGGAPGPGRRFAA